MTHTRALAALFLFGIATPASAFDGATASLDAGLGNLYAKEYVYNGRWKNSELQWESKGVAMLRGSLNIDITPDWRLRGEARTGFKGNGHMVDYDWIYPYTTSNGDSDWSHRSVHSGTELDHYVAGNIEVTRSIFEDELDRIDFGIGARYTDVQWTAYGGSGIYSVGGFRDTAFTIPAGTKGITYRQQIPVVYATLANEHRMGDFTFNGALQAGAMINAKATDDHWLRDLTFVDKFSAAPSFAAKAGIDYNIAPRAAVYLEGAYEYTAFKRGDSTVRDTTNGSSTLYKDTAGGNFSAATINIGIRGSF